MCRVAYIYIFLFLLLFVDVLTKSHRKHGLGRHETRIIGGRNQSIENYNYAVSLMVNGHHFCGGAIITPYFILTAAHCTNGKNVNALSVRAGSSSLKAPGGVIKKVDSYYQHPNFSPEKEIFDVSIVKIKKPFYYNRWIGFVDLPYPGEEVYGYTYGTIAGWGEIDNRGTKSDLLNVANIATIDQIQCSKFYPNVNYLQFCAGSSIYGSHGPCLGDSGAPFVVNGKLVGIAAFSVKCAQDRYPTVFSKISAVRTFISAKAGI